MQQQFGADSKAAPQNNHAASQRAKSQWEQLLGSRTMVLAMLFGVTGFLGLPILWMSNVFSNSEKTIWSVINIIYTLTLIGIVVCICWWCYRQFQNAGIL